MSEQNPTTVATPPAPVKAFAVIQTGYVTKSGDPIVFKDEEGNKTPQVVRVIGDRATAEKIRTRLATAHSKVSKINGQDNRTATPLYGVAEIEGAVGRVRKPMTDEQKKALADRLLAGRKRGKGK